MLGRGGVGAAFCSTSKLRTCSLGFMKPNVLPAQRDRNWGGWRSFECCRGGVFPLGGLPNTPPCRRVGRHQHEGLTLAMEQQIPPCRHAAAADFFWCCSRAADGFSARTWDLVGPQTCVPARGLWWSQCGRSTRAPLEQLSTSLALESSRWWQQVARRPAGREGCPAFSCKWTLDLFFLKNLSYFALSKMTENFPFLCATSGKLGFCSLLITTIICPNILPRILCAPGVPYGLMNHGVRETQSLLMR